MLQTTDFVLLLMMITIFNFFPTKATANDELKTYIVHLASPPQGQKILINSDDELQQWYNSFLLKIPSPLNQKPQMVYSYRHVIKGFAAKMSADQAKAMENLSGVLYVGPDGVYQLHTTRSPEFLGLRQDQGLWKHSNYGTGIIIGIIDSGITPGHPSFDDKGMPPPPPRWKGKCEIPGCNKKLIGIRSFVNGSSPIDQVGHGTHTSSTAAGNSVDNANVYGMANGTARGMAPLAHLAMYKVCGGEFCKYSDVLAGMDAAIEDGVNVISLSLGGPRIPFYKDPIAVAGFTAVQKGVFVSCAAGNGGPENTSLSNEAPWLLTVGASTIDRRIRTSVLLGNKKIFNGESFYQPKGFNHKLRPLVYPGKDGDQNASWCMEGSLGPNKIDVKGKVVLCDVGGMDMVEMGQVVKDARGAAMIIANIDFLGETITAEPHVLPTSFVGYKEGVEIKKYFNVTCSPLATILFGGTVVGLESNPEVAYFSSRGPSYCSPGIVKPDIVGPGLEILAAWHKSVDNRTSSGKATFNMIQGTSMSCPHLSGISALLKSAHPEWSPAAIKSAIMTTASQVNRKRNPIKDERDVPADILTIGSGHVNPSKANEPGLVFDIQPDDYIPYLCGLGYTPKQVQMIVKKAVSCSKTITEEQLNYPSIVVSLKRGETKTYSRTLTNIGKENSTYTIRDKSLPLGVSIANLNDTYELKFEEMYQKLTYHVTFTRDINDGKRGPYGQGHMTWVYDKYTVRVPLLFNFK